MDLEGQLEALLRMFQETQPDYSIPSAPLAGLAPIQLSDLHRPHTRAEGQVLHGVLNVEPRKICYGCTVQVLTSIRDFNGASVFLAIKHAIQSHASQEEVRAAFPLGARVAVKEPVWNDCVEVGHFIALDNPANLVVLSYIGDPQLELLRGMSPAEVWAEANTLFKAGSFHAAAQAYRLSSDLAEKRDPHDQLLALSEQAACLLKLGRFEECIDVADEALALDPSHYKTIHLKASALVELHLYDWASTFLERFSGIHESIDELLFKARKLAEQSHSSSVILEEINKYMEEATKGTPPVPFPKLAAYVGPVEVRMCPDQRFNRGRGMFATGKISRGDVLIVEKSASFGLGKRRDVVVRLLDLAMKSSRGYQQVHSVAPLGGDKEVELKNLEVPEMKLFSPNWITADEWGSYRKSSNRELLEGINVQKVYEIELEALLGEAEPEPSDRVSWSGKFLLNSLINHSCIPNVFCNESDRTAYLIACRDIAAGEEILLSYFSSLRWSFSPKALEEMREFTCDCMKCELERKLEPELEEVRRYGSLQSVLKGDLHVVEMVKKLESVLNSRLETEDERQCVRATFHWALYQQYYELVRDGKVKKVPGIPGAEVIMAAVQTFAAGGGNLRVFEALLPFVSDRVAAEKIVRAGWECMLGRLRDDVYASARARCVLQEVGASGCCRCRPPT